MKSPPKKQIKNQSQTAAIAQNQFKAIVLGTMCLTLFMTNLNDTVMNVALPQIQISLGTNVSGLQWILNAYTLTAASLMLPSGTLGDIYGRKRVFLTGLVIFTTASLVCGFAPSLSILIVGRMLQGVGAAALIPTSLAILTDTFPEPTEKTKAIGVWSAVSGIALVLGPVFGGVLIDNLGWQSVFFLNLPLGAIAFWMTHRFVRQGRHRSRQSLDLPGIVLSVSLLASVTYILTEGNIALERSPWLLAIAIFSLLAFLWVESRSPHPMLPLNVFQKPAFATVNLVNILVFFTFLSLIFIFSLFLQQVQGYSATAAGMRFLPLNAAFVSALLVSGWFAARLGWRFTIAAGLTLASVATFSFIRIGADTQYGVMWIGLVLSGFGGGVTLAPLATVALNSVLPTQAGIASALLNVTTRLGGVLGIAIQGKILSQRLADRLARSLSEWNLTSNLQEQLIADALHGGTKVPSELPAGISASVWHQVFSQAFVSGLHAVILIASVALLVGALLILAFVPSSFKTKIDLNKAEMSCGGAVPAKRDSAKK
jgi:EmrB/QacA subfamily drug resistance transporter